MIKEVFEFRTNAWHARLLYWAWQIKATEIKSLCPYFWLTVLTIFLTPILFIIFRIIDVAQFVIQIVRAGMHRYETYCDEREANWLDKQLILFDDALNKGIENKHMNRLFKYLLGGHRSADYHEKSNMIYNNLNHHQYEKFRALYDAKYTSESIEAAKKAKEDKAELERRTRQQRITKLAVIAKKILIVIGIVAGLALAYALWLLGVWLTTINWIKVLAFTGKALGAITLLVLAAFTVYGLARIIMFLWCKYGAFCIPCQERREAILHALSVIGGAISSPFVWLWNGIMLIVEIIIELKKNHCPAIDWKNDEHEDQP